MSQPGDETPPHAATPKLPAAPPAEPVQTPAPAKKPAAKVSRKEVLPGESPLDEPVSTKLWLKESPPWGLATKAIITCAILILGALVIWRFQFLLTPLVLAAVIAYLINPLVSWLQVKTDIKRGYAVLIVYALFLLVVGGASVFLGLVIAEQSVRMWEALPEFLPRLVDAVQERTQSWASIQWTFGPYVVEPGAVFDSIDWESLAAELGNSLQSVLGRSGLWLANVATATISTLGDTLFVLIVSIYLAMDGPRIGRGIGELAHQPGYRRDAERLIHETIAVWNAYLRGQVILGIVIFVIVTFSLSVLGVNNALELGLLSGVLEFLPIIGPFIGTGAAVIMALVQAGNPWGLSPWVFALIVLGVMVLIQQIENAVLVPRIVGDALDLHPLVVLIGVLMGTSLAGLLGAVLAAPVVATIKLIGTYVWRKMLDLPPFPDRPPDKDPLAAKNDDSGILSRLADLLGAKAPRA
ncbi:MAG: AI-2E family transporter [Caldilineaceae bacterium]|nr:AI-2E family transporter [Caldilineaceae bacterium]